MSDGCLAVASACGSLVLSGGEREPWEIRIGLFGMAGLPEGVEDVEYSADTAPSPQTELPCRRPVRWIHARPRFSLWGSSNGWNGPQKARNSKNLEGVAQPVEQRTFNP